MQGLGRSKLSVGVWLACLFLAACQGNGPGVQVTIVPRQVVLAPGVRQTFTATVTGTPNTAVSWSTTGGTLENGGSQAMYLAPAVPGDYEITATSVADPSRLATAEVRVAAPGETLWTRLMGAQTHDGATCVTIDRDGNIVLAGIVNEGALEGTSAGNADAYVQKRSADGAVLWTRQFGSAEDDAAAGCAVDTDGNVVVVGVTLGSLHGASAGGVDSFVRKYDQDGALLWARQFGSSGTDEARGVAVDRHGNVVVVGRTDGDFGGPVPDFPDAFIRKYSPIGDILWTQRFNRDQPFDAAAVRTYRGDDEEDLYLVASTAGSTTSTEAFFMTFGSEGNLRATKRFGPEQNSTALAIVNGPNQEIYVAGSTRGSLGADNAGGADAFVRKYGPDGLEEWTRQFGTNAEDLALGVARDSQGNVFALIATLGGGDHNVDALVRKYNSSGDVVWTSQLDFGDETFSYALPTGLTLDDAGAPIIVGTTDAALDGVGEGVTKGYVTRLSP